MDNKTTKSEPREFWLADNTYNCPYGTPKGFHAYPASQGEGHPEQIHVREVLDEPFDLYAELNKAQKEGKVIQSRLKGSDGLWITARPYWSSFYEYRIKPEPHYRPWKPEEVPVGARIRIKETSFYSIIASCADNSVWIPQSGYYLAQTLSLDKFEHSLDHGKTWLPCGVLYEE